jgi:hypothetical protein
VTKCTCLCAKDHRAVHAGRFQLVDPPRLVLTRDMLPPTAPAAVRESLPIKAPAPPVASIVFAPKGNTPAEAEPTTLSTEPKPENEE